MGIQPLLGLLLGSLLLLSCQAFRSIPPIPSRALRATHLPLTSSPPLLLEKLWGNLPSDLYAHLSFFSPILIIQGFIQSVPKTLTIFRQLHWIYILDILLICGSLAVYRPLFYLLFKWTHKPTDNYRKSLFGHLERPLSYTMYYGPFLYLIDFFSILFHNLGFEFHLKVNITSLLLSFNSVRAISQEHYVSVLVASLLVPG